METHNKITYYDVRYGDAIKITVGIDEMKLDEIWGKAAPYFPAIDYDEIFDQKKNSLHTVIIMVARDLFRMSLTQFDPSSVGMIDFLFINKHPWYTELEQKEMFFIKSWPQTGFFPGDFMITEFDNEGNNPY